MFYRFNDSNKKWRLLRLRLEVSCCCRAKRKRNDEQLCIILWKLEWSHCPEAASVTGSGLDRVGWIVGGSGVVLWGWNGPIRICPPAFWKGFGETSLATNVFVMDWLSQALAHPFRRYSFLPLQSTIVPKVCRPWSKSETESSHLQSEQVHWKQRR